MTNLLEAIIIGSAIITILATYIVAALIVGIIIQAIIYRTTGFSLYRFFNYLYRGFFNK